MHKICICILIVLLLASCSDSEEIESNITISNAIALMNSVTTNTDITVTLQGKASEHELLLLKETLTSLEYRKTGTGFLSLDMTELSGIKAFDPQYFGNLSMLKSVKLPECLTEVSKYLFFGCNYLEDVTIEKNVKYIGYEAFADCKRLKTLNVKPKTLEIKKNAFLGLNELVEIKKDRDFVMYCFDGSPFDNTLFGTFYNCLPTRDYIPVSRTFISKEGNEKTMNLSVKYSSDTDFMYLFAINNDTLQTAPKKIVTMLRGDDTCLITSETDIDGFTPDVPYGANQKIVISHPSDGSKWYVTKSIEVFYSWDKNRAYAIPFEDRIVIKENDYYEYYFFKAK